MANWRFVGTIHRWVYQKTGGRVGGNLAGLTMLLLTTRGRRSGEPRTTPLACMADGRDWVVVGSNNGGPSDPAWCLNLKANPAAEIEVGREHLRVTAEIARGALRERLWPALKRYNPAYVRYEQQTEREIPVVVLRASGPGNSQPGVS